jgi:IS5 family transposase
MRFLQSNQLWLGSSSLESAKKKNPIIKELIEISKVLDVCPKIQEVLERVKRDLVGERKADCGKTGLTAEQALRAGIVKEKFDFTYRELEFHLLDSMALRDFVRLEPTKRVKKSVLNRDIRLISEETWEFFNEQIKRYAEVEKIENGSRVRSDTTATEANIHHPTDSSLLFDCVRVLTRLMSQANEWLSGMDISYRDHSRRAKSRKYKINNCKKADDRQKHYRDLIRVTGWVQEYATDALPKLKNYKGGSICDEYRAANIAQEIERYLGLTSRVLSQAIRRVLEGEEVPSNEKVVSIFETHTDIIEKGARETIFGHKVCVSSGRSGLILDCMVLEGNPSDSTLVEDVITRHRDSYGRVPSQIVFDGGFASAENITTAENLNVEDIVFPKKKGIEPSCSDRVFKMLSNFRAGIEAGISALKRSYGFGRVFAKGWRAFKTSLFNGMVAFNLTLIARHRLQKQKA